MTIACTAPWIGCCPTHADSSSTCNGAANQIRSGLDGWDRLTPPIWKDDRSVDVNMRAALISGIRAQLQSWNGRLNLLRQRKSWTEDWIEKSGWPAASPQAGPTTTTPTNDDRLDTVPVEL